MASEAPSRQASFLARSRCIACRSTEVATLDAGTYSQDPVRSFIEQDPWGVPPLPFLGDHPWEFVQCKRCGQMYQKWLLTPEWQEIRFREWMTEEAIREFERTRGGDLNRAKFEKGTGFARHILRIEKMTRSLRGPDAVRVLDFGSGWGEFLVMARLFAFDPFGIDRSPDRQAALRDQGVTVLPDIDAARQAVPGGYHAVSMFQVLEHVEEPLEILTALRETMIPDAILILEVPDCSGITGIHSRSDYYNIHPLEHMNCFTPPSLSAMARRAGFEPERPTIAHVTTDPKKVLKQEAKRVLGRFARPSINQYFRRRG